MAYAREQVQGRAPSAALPKSGPIIEHPDIRRMLMSMRAREAMRALTYVVAAMDAAEFIDPEGAQATQGFRRADDPGGQGWNTEVAQGVTSDGIPVHGGMGFIEETGAAQFYRDARIITIYEGTAVSRPTTSSGARPHATAGALPERWWRR